MLNSGYYIAASYPINEALGQRCDEITQSIATLQSLIGTQQHPSLNQEQKEALQLSAQHICRDGRNFTSELQKLTILNQEFILKHIDSINALLTQAIAVYKNPTEMRESKKFQAAINKVNQEWEASSAWHGLYTAGRVLLGSLVAFAGIAIAFVSLATGVGLLLTLGCGLFTMGKNWGPLTVANKVLDSGFDIAADGPTLEQRNAARELLTSAEELKDPASIKYKAL